MSFKPYPKYKESGVEWLGRVPEHWEVLRLKYHLDRNDGGVWGDDPPGSEGTVVLRSTEQAVDGRWQIEEPAKRLLSPAEESAALLAEGDLLLTKSSGSSLHIGKTSLVDADVAAMKCCYSNFMQRLRMKSTLSPKLAWYFLNNDIARKQFDLLSNSTTGLANLNASIIGHVVLPSPPPEEQPYLTSFLDHETAKIDALIAEQQRLIELLQEKRQSVISHAVTKGLNPSAPMKDSGIEWLGEVPEHWAVTRFKRIAAVGNGSTPSRERPDYWEGGDYPWLNSAVVNNSPVDPPGQFVTPVALAECHLPRVQPPAVLVGLTGQGRTRGMASLLLYEATVSQHLGVLVPRAGMKAAFLKRVLDMAYPYLRRDSEEAGSTKGAITCEALANFALASPPADEQREISEYLDDQSRLFDALAREALEGISLLQERRSALISAAVTGQIDVRSFTAGGSEAA